MADSNALAQFNLRLAPELKEKLEVAARREKRSTNLEIVTRLERSFELEAAVHLMLELAEDSKVSSDELRVLVADRMTTVLRAAGWDRAAAYNTLRDRIGAESDLAYKREALHQERAALEQLKRERAQQDMAREEQIDRLMAAMRRVIAASGDTITGSFLINLEPKIMDITTESRILWARIKDDVAVPSEVKAEYGKMVDHISKLAQAVTEAVDAATGTSTPELPQTVKGGETK